MTPPELTQAMIAQAMARAEKVTVCRLDDLGYLFPDPLDEARETRAPNGP